MVLYTFFQRENNVSISFSVKYGLILFNIPKLESNKQFKIIVIFLLGFPCRFNTAFINGKLPLLSLVDIESILSCKTNFNILLNDVFTLI